jgi:hypothetical protein
MGHSGRRWIPLRFWLCRPKGLNRSDSARQSQRKVATFERTTIWRLQLLVVPYHSLRAVLSARQHEAHNRTVAATDLLVANLLPVTSNLRLLPLLVRPNGELVSAEIWFEQHFFRAQISRLK